MCGLKWSPDNRQLASGGNDNQLCIWSLNRSSPIMKFSEHTAAVKAIAWSPHQHGLLASGGGTADRCIRFWNTATNTKLNTIDTGSQVRSCQHSALLTLFVSPRTFVDVVTSAVSTFCLLGGYRPDTLSRVKNFRFHTQAMLLLAMF